MSADNGIYIGQFPRGKGFEYRVIHAQAIENCEDGTPEEQDYFRVIYYGHAPSFSDQNEATELACKLAETYNILEYGIWDIIYDRPLLSITVEEAERLLYGEQPCH